MTNMNKEDMATLWPKLAGHLHASPACIHGASGSCTNPAFGKQPGAEIFCHEFSYKGFSVCYCLHHTGSATKS